MSKFIFNLGVKAKCKLTGFEGIVISRCDHITGCNSYGLKPKIDKDKKIQKTEWFDEGMMEQTGKGIKVSRLKR